MYRCLGCGANLRFDIEKQLLKCDSCDSEYQVDEYDQKYKIEEESDIEGDEYQAYICTCPNCGGEIITNDENTIASYCSYCGASAILERRMKGIKKPQRIIPFSISREKCKERYKQFAGKVYLLPKELKDKNSLEKFRGIYMPYWSYSINHEGTIETTADGEEVRKGDYLYTDHYNVKADIKDEQSGISYDASSSFDDEFSQTIAPFDYKKSKDFSSAYLCGFFADMADVEENTYAKEAGKVADEITYRSLSNNEKLKKLKLHDNTEGKIKKTRAMENGEASLFPVWFMTYNKNDRVAYTIVNGQTGKTFGDMPVSVSKYILFTLLFSIPVYILFEIFLTVIPGTLLTYSTYISMITTVTYLINMKKLEKRERHCGDKGFKNAAKVSGNYDKVKENKEDSDDGNYTGTIAVITILMIVGIGVIYCDGSDIVNFFTPFLLIIEAGATIVANYVKRSKKLIRKYRRSSGILLHIISMIVAALLTISTPAQDMYYYIATAILLLGIAASNISLINKYNVRTTRPLPQFNREGGEQK